MTDSGIIVAALSLIGTLGGSLFGVLASSRLTAYRIEQLEKKVEKHNNVIERTFRLEEQMKSINRRMEENENGS